MSRITPSQETYLIRLMREAFSKHYTFASFFGHVAENQVGKLSKENASKLIQHLLDAKARNWSAWETTPEAKSKAQHEETKAQGTRKRVEILKTLKAQGLRCDCFESGNRALCPLHVKFDTLSEEK